MRADAALARVRYDFPERGQIIVGLSGGADSVLLTHLLAEKYDISRLCCVHVHHGIRGEAADADEAFVTDFCRRRGLRLAVFRRDVPRLAKEAHESLEACARRVRYDCFFSCVQSENDRIATAHNADDNAETLLLNLTRGMGPRGAAGIPARRGNIVRPLLAVSRAEVEALCAAFALPFVTDETNLADDYTRNRLRHHVLPVLKGINPEAVAACTRFSESMAVQNDFVQGAARALLEQAEVPFGLSLAVLRAAHEAVLRAALEIFLAPLGRLHYAHILEAAETVRCGGTLMLPTGARLFALQDTLTLAKKPAAPFCVPVCGAETALPNGKTLLLRKKPEEIEKNIPKIHNLLFKNLPVCDKMTKDFVVRTRRAGDRFAPAGRGVTKSVKKLLNEMRVPASVRDELVLLELSGQIIWLEGAGAAEGYAAGAGEAGYAVSVVCGQNTDEGERNCGNGKCNDG